MYSFSLSPLKKGKNVTPQVNQKVKILRDKSPDRYGIITEVHPPNNYHSGRFRVLIHEKSWAHNEEFWFSDYGKSVINSK